MRLLVLDADESEYGRELLEIHRHRGPEQRRLAAPTEFLSDQTETTTQ